MEGTLLPLILFAIPVIQLSSAVPVGVLCGVPYYEPVLSTSRIVGGEKAREGSWPWMVMLKQGGYQACGASLLNREWVLSAAHCFDSGDGVADPTGWEAFAGKHSLYDKDASQQISTIAEVHIHPSYDPYTVIHDVALLRMSAPFYYTTHVRPICLPDADLAVDTSLSCAVTGWGETLGTSDDSELNQLLMPILGDNVCSQDDWYGPDYHPPSMICAGYPDGGKDTCTGDSGGPLVCEIGSTWVQIGITSWGVDCAFPQQPGVYSEVQAFRQWIEQLIQ